MVTFSIRSGDFKSAFLYAEFFRNRYLVDRIAQQYAPLPATVDSELTTQIKQMQQAERKALQAYTDGISDNLDATQLKDLNEQWDAAKKALENLYRQVSLIEPEFIAKTKVYPISFAEVQALLPPDTAILEFFFTENRLISILILPGADSPIIPEDLCLNNHREIASLAKAWMVDISANSKDKKEREIDQTIQDLPDRIDRISDLLNFRNLLNYLNPDQIKHIIIVPHSYLYLFPIHALWLNEFQRLIDCFSVQYFPNLQVWKICQTRQRSGSSFIAIENPSQDKDLIFSKAEVASICRHNSFIKPCILSGSTASQSFVLQSAENYNYFHFSGHAEYNSENPLDSYLMLSQNSDENLTLSKILADLHIPHTDLVTLSACCTGVVDAFQPIDECLGLATGFLLAGAKAVVSSLWKVNSIATAFLLDEFYRQLEETHNKAISLQNAQNWLRCRTADDLRERAASWDLSKLESKEKFLLDITLDCLNDTHFENPYYWAAFILTGC